MEADPFPISDGVENIIREDERKTPKHRKQGMTEDEETREFPKIIIHAIIALVIILPVGILLYDVSINGTPFRSSMSGSPDVYHAEIRKAENNGAIAAAYHDAALINFSRGQYDIAIEQMALAAHYSLRSTNDYLAAVREMSEDYKYAYYSSEGTLYMHEAEMGYLDAFKSYRTGDAENASIYWDDAKHYIELSAVHRVVRD